MKKSPGRATLICSALLLPVLLLDAGCTKQNAAQAAPATTAVLPTGLQPAASIIDLMHDPIDTAANRLWQAVYSTSTQTGTEDVVPANDEEWLALRRQALLLMEAGNLLVVEGRPVAHPGQKLEGQPDSSSLTPQQAQAEIDKNRAVYLGFSAALQVAAGGLLTAIDARSAQQYLDAGDTLQQACENCHLRFWYPNAAQPPAP